MQPAPEQDAVMGPPPVPYQSNKAAELEMSEKYKKLKRRYYELEEKNKEVLTELQRAGERNVKMREERNILLDRIIELESQQRTHPNTSTPQAPSSAYPRSLNDARTRAAFMANLARASEEFDLEPEDGDPRLLSRHMNAIAEGHRRADLDKQLALEDDMLRESRRAKKRAKTTETNGKPRGRNGNDGDFNSPPSPVDDFEAGYNQNLMPLNVLQMSTSGGRPVSPAPSVPGPDFSPTIDSNIDPALLNSQPPNGQKSTTPPGSPKLPPSNPYLRGPIPGILYPHNYPHHPPGLPPGAPVPTPIAYSPMIHYEPPVASSSKPHPNRQPLVPSPPEEEPKGPKQKRARTQAAVARPISIPLIPRDTEGRPLLPLTVGIMTLISLGEICTRDHFHTERYIFPIGFEATRKYLSTVNPKTEAVYHCSILDGGDGPKFKIIPSDAPDHPVVAGTATGAWSSIVKEANRIRNRNHSNSVSGPDFFGLGQNTIRHLIQDLPNARSLRDYARQIFVEGGFKWEAVQPQ